MKSVKINRLELLTIVTENRIKHVAEYEESVEDYKKVVLKIAKDNLKAAKTQDLDMFKTMKIYPATPTSYKFSYDKAIRMLELSVEDVIDVDESTFNQLVLDEWQWKAAFSISNSTLKSYF